VTERPSTPSPTQGDFVPREDADVNHPWAHAHDHGHRHEHVHAHVRDDDHDAQHHETPEHAHAAHGE